jgi:hypothetical protein
LIAPKRLATAIALLACIGLGACGSARDHRVTISQGVPAISSPVEAHTDFAEAADNPILQRLGKLPPFSPQQAALAEGVLNGAAGRGCGPNGFIRQSCLRAIYQGELIRKAAGPWNAMNAKAQRPRSRGGCGLPLYPGGTLSSYRSYRGQYYLWNSPPHAHDRNWKAFPGTSNHGWGLAVDLATMAMRFCVDRIGRFFGFSKACSDAQLEWWHVRYNPACTHARWRPPAKSRASRRARCSKRHTKRSRQRCLRHVR